MRRRSSRTIPLTGAIVAAMTGALGLSAHATCDKVYTTTADFKEGTFFNTQADDPADQVQLVDEGDIQAFPFLWIANAGEDTVSKIDSATGREVARYRTWFGPSGQSGYVNHLNNPWAGAAPSRTAVDGEGNVYVANRMFNFTSNGVSSRLAVVIKILSSGGIDRNGNGMIDTSSDADNNGVIGTTEILSMADTNNNGLLDPDELTDERIAWAVTVGSTNDLGDLGRSLSIHPDGTIWLGYYNSGTYYQLRASDGATLGGPFVIPSQSPYGSVIDSNGMLYSADLGTRLGRLDTANAIANNPPFATTFVHSVSDYGIALGTDPVSGNRRVYLANQSGGSYIQFDTVTTTFSFPALSSVTMLGISVDAANNIVCGDGVGGSGNSGASKFAPSGANIWSAAAQPGGTGDQRGAIVDSNGDVWTVNRDAGRVSKFRGTDGAPLGVFPVGNQPYTYSDASGSTFVQTNPVGTWRVVYDAGERGVTGDTAICWTAQIPGQSILEVKVDASENGESVGDYDPNSLPAIGNGDALGTEGRYVFVQVRFVSAGQEGPILEDLTIKGVPRKGDVNGDDCVDLTDLNLVLGDCVDDPANNNPDHDVNGDGIVTIADARKVVLLFCNPGGVPCN